MDLQFPEVSARYGADPHSGSEPEWHSDYEASVRNYCNACYEEATWERDNSDELKKVGEYVDYLHGRQWKAGAPSYRARPVNNKTKENFWELVGLMTDIKPSMDVHSTNPEKPFQEAAPVLNKGIKSWALNTDFDMKLALTVCNAILTTAYQKFQWNPDLDMGEGNIECVPLGPNDLMALRMKHDIQSSLAIIRDEAVSLGWLKRRYPTRGYLVRPDEETSTYQVGSNKPPQIPSMLWEILTPAVQRWYGVKPQVKIRAHATARYREFWFRDFQTNTTNVPVWMGQYNWRYKVKPGGLLYPRGRLICRAGEVTLSDGPNPYWHGRYPFTCLRMNVVPWQAFGLSDMKDWTSLNDIINQILSGVINMMKKNLNPTFYAPKNAFSDAVWQNLDFSKPGEKAMYNVQSPHKPDFAPGPILPGYILNVYGMIEKALETQGGRAMANTLAGKKQVPGSDTVESLQFMRSTPTRLKGRNVEICLRDGGQLMVPTMLQFWTKKRRMMTLGPLGTVTSDFDWDPESMVPANMAPEEFVKSFHFYVEPGSLLNTEKRQRIMDAMTLRRQGDLSRKSFYKILDVGLDAEKEEKEMLREKQAGMPPTPPKGHGGKQKGAPV